MHTRPRAAGKLLLAVCSFVVMSAAPAARSGWAHAAAADDAARPGRFERLTERAFAWVASDERSSNGALFIGDREALAVDPGLTPSIVRGFLRATRRITDRPIRTVVLTHWHPDHAMGVVCLTERTFTVLAHPQTRRSLAQRAARLFRRMADRAEGRDDPFAGRECEVDLPDRTIEDRETVDLGRHRIAIFHPGPAHTRGDLIVRSLDESVLVTGDLFMRDACPSMGEGSVLKWVEILGMLEKTAPRHVVPGHFAPGTAADLRRFRDYLTAQIEQVRSGLARGRDPGEIAAAVDLPAFSSFREFPQYGATFADNARTIAREIASRPAPRGRIAGFTLRATIDAGRNPHQIAFSPDGGKAYVAAAGSDRVTVIDARTYRVVGSLDTTPTPLGVAVGTGGAHLLVSLFGADAVVRYDIESKEETGRLVTGGAPSLLVGPNPDGTYLVSSEKADRLWVLDAKPFSLRRSYPTGKRPFPPAATSDGRLAFVPGYDDGTVTIVDLWNHRVLDTIQVGDKPSGGAVLPGDAEYAVAVRGTNRVALINTASHRVVETIGDGIGEGPFSVVVSPEATLAFVNNTASHDVSVIKLADRRIVARIPIGEIPIVIAVHPSGETLWVSSEGSHRVSVLDIPRGMRRRAPAEHPPSVPGRSTEVAVFGMIHGRHRTSRAWGLDQVRETILRLKPDFVCAEIPPDRWERIWSDYTERGVIEDDRVKLFPEYTDLLLSLSVKTGLRIIPCAGWTKEMSDLRRERIKQFNTDPAHAARHDEYESRLAAVQARYDHPLDDIDDPFLIHSDEYDRRMKEELSLYDEYLNDWIGPGGWSNINEAHMKLIDKAIREHPGRRILITFGAGHKYWFLKRLRARSDIELLDIRPFLPAGPRR